MTPNLENLKNLLSEVGKFVHPSKERTLFSLGGRGYYENPASDMLAFFLNPNEEHGFKSLFLTTFFECMGVDASREVFDGAWVRREVGTENDKWIDLLIIGSEWVLVIENKVRHIQNNPFESYEKHVKPLGKRTYFAILSPDGKSQREGWKGVSYKNFLEALRRRFTEAMFEIPYSKWQVFAREFILHMQNELYNPIMTENEADFVEKNAEQIAQVKKLDLQYRQFLLEEFRQRLGESLPGHVITTKDEPWGISCFSDKLSNSRFAFWTADTRKMHVGVWLLGLTSEQNEMASDEFKHEQMSRVDERQWQVWKTNPDHGFDNRKEAIDKLCKVAGIVAKLRQAPPAPPSPPQT